MMIFFLHRWESGCENFEPEVMEAYRAESPEKKILCLSALLCVCMLGLNCGIQDFYLPRVNS